MPFFIHTFSALPTSQTSKLGQKQGRENPKILKIELIGLLVHRFFELFLLQKLEYEKYQFSAQGRHSSCSNMKNHQEFQALNTDLQIQVHRAT